MKPLHFLATVLLATTVGTSLACGGGDPYTPERIAQVERDGQVDFPDNATDFEYEASYGLDFLLQARFKLPENDVEVWVDAEGFSLHAPDMSYFGAAAPAWWDPSLPPGSQTDSQPAVGDSATRSVKVQPADEPGWVWVYYQYLETS